MKFTLVSHTKNFNPLYSEENVENSNTSHRCNSIIISSSAKKATKNHVQNDPQKTRFFEHIPTPSRDPSYFCASTYTCSQKRNIFTPHQFRTQSLVNYTAKDGLTACIRLCTVCTPAACIKLSMDGGEDTYLHFTQHHTEKIRCSPL